jgi:MFS family permease
MYMYFIPVFARTFGATFLDLGIIGTVWASATAVTPIVAGHLSDRKNRAWIYCLALIANAIAAAILVFARSILDIVILRLIGGIAIGAFWPTAEVLVADIASAERRVMEMGRYSISLALGSLIGPFIGGIVIEALGYTSLFLISSLLICVSVIQTVIWIVPNYRKRESARSAGQTDRVRTVKRLIPWYLMLVCYGAVWGLTQTIFPGYANSVGIGAGLIGVIFSAFGVTRIVSCGTAHRFVKLGEKRALFLVSILITTGILILAVLPGFLMFLAGILLIGAGTGYVFPIIITLIARHFPDEQIGAAVGSFETSTNIGETICPYLAGVLAAVTNIESSFLMMSIFGVLMAVFALNGKTEMK